MYTNLTNEAGNVSISITYDEVNHWVTNTWFGYHTFESMSTGATACLLPIRKFQCPYLLNDQRLILGLWDHSVNWGITEWGPKAVKAGLTHIAHVLAPDSMASLSAAALCQGFAPNIQMRMFSEIEEAKAWLRTMQQATSTSEADNSYSRG